MQIYSNPPLFPSCRTKNTVNYQRAKEHFTTMATSLCQQELALQTIECPYTMKTRRIALMTSIFWEFFLSICKNTHKPKYDDSTPPKKTPQSALLLLRKGYSENRFFIYSNIAQQAKRGKIKKAGSLNDAFVKKAFSADPSRVTPAPSYTTALREAHML